MSKQFFKTDFYRLCCLLSVFLLLATNVLAVAENAPKQIKGPITITSEMLTADNQAHTALFEQSVIARTTDMTMYADRMLVYYDEGTGDVTRIDASGTVKVIKGNRVITSREAVYFADGGKVIFTGEPKAVEGENVVTGKKITYLMNEDRFLVESSKVFLTKKKEQ
jgi:lipopolysaccharide export system protein LptA